MTLESVVPGVGLEPTHLAAGDFESPASTNFATSALKSLHYKFISRIWQYIENCFLWRLKIMRVSYTNSTCQLP